MLPDTPPKTRATQRGQSMVEYVVICSLLALALFAPIPGEQNRTAAQMLADAVRQAYSSLSFFLSLP
jgi:Flp pilus assembly pilin Flp